jgi:DNA repair exonuclease SbcCD ATPase subunit
VTVELPADLLDRLYTTPPERFIAARDEAVTAARRAGDRRTAEAIGKLRKPTVAAWLVNLLARNRSDLIEELLALGSALRSAQHDLRGDELRELSGQRRAMIGKLVGQARALARGSGRESRDALPLAEVEATLSAALSEPEVAEAVRDGMLTRATGYAGFGETPKPKLRVIDGGLTETAKPETEKPADRRGAQKAEQREALRQAEEAARTRAREAQAELRRATEAEREAARVLADLTAQLEELRARQAEAQLELRRARLRVKTAQRAAGRTGA